MVTSKTIIKKGRSTIGESLFIIFQVKSNQVKLYSGSVTHQPLASINRDPA